MDRIPSLPFGGVEKLLTLKTNTRENDTRHYTGKTKIPGSSEEQAEEIREAFKEEEYVTQALKDESNLHLWEGHFRD